MKKLISFLILLSINYQSFGAVAEGSGRSSARVSSAESETARVTNEQIINTTAQTVAMNAAIQNNDEINKASFLNKNLSPAKGMLTCDAHYYKRGSGYIYEGCLVDNEKISIEDYFNRYKPADANKITMVIADYESERFYIYFN